MAILIRRTLTRTWASILKSLSRMVPHVATANWVWSEPDRAQRGKQEVGEGGDPEPKLVGTHDRH